MMRALCAVLVAAGSLQAQALSVIFPRGVQRGVDADVTFYGARLDDPLELVQFGTGIEVLEFKKAETNRVTVSLRVAPDCPLGPQLVALRTKNGRTRAQTLHVSPLPSVRESRDDNATFKVAQEVDLNVSIDGRIDAEDIDWFRFNVAEPGQRVQFDVEGVRLGNADWDPMLEFRGPDGAKLGRSDDSALGRMDPVVSRVFDEVGPHYVGVRDASWGGSGRHFYRLHIGTFPQPTGVLPSGNRAESDVEARWLGDAVGAVPASLQMPAGTGIQPVYPTDGTLTAPTPTWLRLSAMPVTLEGSKEKHGVPSAGVGVLEKQGEVDRFTFSAKKGQRLQIASITRRLRSPVDTVLVVRDAKNKVLGSNDDSNGPDSRVRLRVPEDGDYTVTVYDHLRRGGSDWFWRVEVTEEKTYFSTREAVPGRRAEDFGVTIARGGRQATVLAATGVDYAAGIKLAFPDLPKGVTVDVPEFVTGWPLVPVVFTAAADAPLAHTLTEVGATARQEPTKRKLYHRHLVPQLRVRNQQVYGQNIVERVPVVVREALPFRIDIEAPEAPIVQGASIQLPVTVHRDKGFKGSVVVRVIANPPGVTSGSATLRGDTTTATVQLNASGSAATRTWPLCVYAYSNVGGENRLTTSAIVPLEVTAPLVVAASGRVRGDQGVPQQLVVKLDHKKAFEGEAVAELVRLPKGITTTPQKFKAGDESITFPLTIAKDAPVGRHRSQYLLLRVPGAGGDIVHRAYGGEVRVDRPLPPQQKVESKGGQR